MDVVVDGQTSIGSLLASLRDLQAIYVRVKKLSALQQSYAAALPSELSRRTRVSFERSGTVVVFADNGAVAAKLRHLAPRIVSEIVKAHPEVTSIRVEVQVAQSSMGPARTRPSIGLRGLASLVKLRDALPEAPLRAALSRLITRAPDSDSEHKPLEREEGDKNQS
ncbi:MAG: hypothetical protein C5B46_01340 [Proteobacteria bacterium]|nr:MAG: hypothetical protein C5B46_01340 [Pseudomonadota bacterium]